jgi:hypothetical protein
MLGIDDSTAPIAAECQSFLDNVIAQFDDVWAWNDRRGQRESWRFDSPHEMRGFSLAEQPRRRDAV